MPCVMIMLWLMQAASQVCCRDASSQSCQYLLNCSRRLAPANDLALQPATQRSESNGSYWLTVCQRAACADLCLDCTVKRWEIVSDANLGDAVKVNCRRHLCAHAHTGRLTCQASSLPVSAARSSTFCWTGVPISNQSLNGGVSTIVWERMAGAWRKTDARRLSHGVEHALRSSMMPCVTPAFIPTVA